MSKFGINVPKGVAVSSLDEIPKAIKDTFPGQDEVNSANYIAFVLSVNFGTFLLLFVWLCL